MTAPWPARTPPPSPNPRRRDMIWVTIMIGILAVGALLAVILIFPRTVEGTSSVSADDDIAPIPLRPVTTSAPTTPPCPSPGDLSPTEPMDTCSVDEDTYYALQPVVGTIKPTGIAVSTNATGDEVITVTIDPASRQWFAEYTAAHIGEQLAWVRSGRVVTAPAINSAIDTLSIEVSGLDGPDEARRIADLLISGS